MSEVTEPAAQPVEEPPTPPESASAGLLRDAAFVLAWFVVVGVLAAVVWWQLTPLAEYTRSTTSAQMGEDQLGREVSADGWYFVVGGVAALVSGIALVVLRARDPLATVVLVALGSLLAAWVMLRVGLWLGPPDPDTVLPHTAVGDKVPMQLKTQAAGLPFVWPIAAMLGAVGVLWGLDDHRRDAPVDG